MSIEQRPTPTPVDVVRVPKGPGYPQRIVEAIPTAILTSILTAFFLALWAPNISTYVSLFRPSGADPQGLVEVPHSEISARADSQDEVDHPAGKLLDGRVANIWVPPMQRPAGTSKSGTVAVIDPDQSLVTLTLAKKDDVQLVCVVNGLANSYDNYLNWGRVRSVRAWTDDNASKESSVLESMDQGSFQNFQDVRTPRGDAKMLMIQILDAYEGQQMVSVDPDVCDTRDEVGRGPQNDPVGCNLNATPKAGLAEIKVYRLEKSRWKALFDF